MSSGFGDGFTAFVEATQPLMLTVAPLSNGFIVEGGPLAFVTENELYAAQARSRDRREEIPGATPKIEMPKTEDPIASGNIPADPSKTTPAQKGATSPKK